MVIFVDMKLWLSWPHVSVMRDMMSRAWFWNISPFVCLILSISFVLIRCRCVSACLTYPDVWLQITGILYSVRASTGLIFENDTHCIRRGFIRLVFRRLPYLHRIINLSRRRQLVILVTVDTGCLAGYSRHPKWRLLVYWNPVYIIGTHYCVCWL